MTKPIAALSAGLLLSFSNVARADDLVCHSTVINAVATTDAPRLSVIQCDRSHSPLPALRWSAASLAATSLTLGIAFEMMAVQNRNDLATYEMQRDAMTGLPLVRYSDIEALDRQRVQNEVLGASFLIAGGVLAATSLALWLVPAHGPVGHAAARLRERVAVGVAPTAVVLGVTF